MRLVIREKDSYPKDTRQKEGGGQTKNIWREKCCNKAVFVNMLLLSHDFRKFTIVGASIEKIRGICVKNNGNFG